jgi:hypothetical protein
MQPLHALRTTVAILGMTALLGVGCTFLPDNLYYRYQQLDETIYSAVRTSFERMHFDPTPIDVVIFGDSGAQRGVSSGVIEEALEADGCRAHVYNMAMVASGRNVQWALFHELLQTKRPKVAVFAVGENPYPWGHNAFRYIASPVAVWREAFHGLHDAKKNLVFLPFRQLRLFAKSIVPALAGSDRRFDPQSYAETLRSRELGRTVGYRRQNGTWVDVTKPTSIATLRAQAYKRRNDYNKKSRLPGPIRRFVDADNRVYTDMIVEAAARHGVKIVFLYIPGFERFSPIGAREYYEAIGPIQDNSDLAGDPKLYLDSAHVNARGMRIVSTRLADAIEHELRVDPTTASADCDQTKPTSPSAGTSG